MRYKLIVFDWDGTLMDSTRKIVNCFQAAAADIQIFVPSASLIEHQIGLSLEKAWANIFTHLGIRQDFAISQRAVGRYRDYFLDIDQTSMPLFEGVAEGVHALNEAGYLLAIATGKARVGLRRALQETTLASNFVYSRCGDETFSKPHPQMLLDILEYCGCEPQDALMVGDTTYDMQMAINAKVDGLAVAYGVHSSEMLTPLATKGCAADFSQTLDLILNKP